MKVQIAPIVYVFFSLLSFYTDDSYGQFTQSPHKAQTESVVAISEPGSYGKAGTTYLLTKDISSERSTIFLGKDVTLDLNGYTLSYADGKYEHIPNYGFEDGLTGWDISKAPNAKIEDTKVHVFIGDKILRLKAGEEISSQYINLPVPDRSYFAMCGVTKRDMKVSVYVEDIHGNTIRCTSHYTDGTTLSAPIENRSPRLGGGFVFAHLTGLSAGKYRVRVRAETDCLLDHIDIRPSMDVGIGIVEEVHAVGHNDHLYERAHSAFFDYADDSTTKAIMEIPVVKGEGSVTIKNGIIKNGTVGVMSWGIQSTAQNVKIVLDNVKIITSGINTSAVDVPQAIITRSTFDVTSPFIINRHGSEFYGVDLRGDRASEVSYSEFYGGQGCLVFKGNFSKIHHNLFVNRQRVTNHYSIMAMGDSSQIFENVIKPEMGSGIEVYIHRGMEIYNNEIWTKAEGPTCEYGHEEFSTTAIRLADYNAAPESARGCYGNKIYNNKIHVISRDYPEYLDYTPMAWAVYYSASGGENYIFGNDIYLEDLSIGMKNEAGAFYVGGGSIGGQFYNNRITTNAHAAWVGSRYGSAAKTQIFNNTIIKSGMADSSFKPFRIGFGETSIATDIEFRSNDLKNTDLGFDVEGEAHSYSVFWTLEIELVDKKGNPAGGVDVDVLDGTGKRVRSLISPEDGIVNIELPQFIVNGSKKMNLTPYTIRVGKKKETVVLKKNSKLIVKL